MLRLPASYEPLVAPARRRAELWRSIVGLGLIAGIYFLWMAGMGAVLWLWRGTDGFATALQRVAEAGDPWSLVRLLSTFLGGWLGIWATMHLLHRRRLRSLLGRRGPVLRDFVTGIVLMAVVGGGLTLLTLPLLPPLAVRPDLGLWLAFLPLALAGIALQTGAEELVFRGYLQSQLAARFAQPLIYLTLPSILFGMAHHSSDMGELAWLIVAATGLFGLIAADLTQRSGTLGLAWGLHFANNILAILVISVSGTLDGLSLLTPAQGAGVALRPLLIADMALLVAVWAACRLWLRRR